jgi:hypothetical protein
MKLIAKRDGVWKCALCGQPSPDQDKPHLGACRCSDARPGLGDLTAAGLGAIGITKERAQAVARAAGLEDCGCGERQRQMNEWGYRLGIGTPPSTDA